MGWSVDGLAYPNTIVAASRSRHRRCARCGKVVSRRAIVCRRCGKQQRVNPRTTMLALAGFFLIALFGVATVGSQVPNLRRRFGRAHAAEATPPRDAVSQATTAGLAAGTILTATELWDLYNLDADKADARFRDKTVNVTGTVADVRHDFRGNLLLRLSTSEPFDNVRATVLGRDDGPRPLATRGQVVTLHCTGHGALIGAPLLEGCVPL
jgi:tRNA_anti-like